MGNCAQPKKVRLTLLPSPVNPIAFLPTRRSRLSGSEERRYGQTFVMKRLSETKAMEVVNRLKREFAASIRENYERRAESCVTCETPGVCCSDAHCVNVRISRLEAA